MVSMNRLTTARRAQILAMMVEGNSIRAITRMTGASKNTIIRLLEDAGEAFSEYQDRTFRDLKLKRIQLDEIWAFCYAKQRNVMLAKAAPEEAGDIWTWVAIDAETKLVPSWRIGDRSGDRVCMRSLGQIGEPRTGHERRAPGLSGSRGSRFRCRYSISTFSVCRLVSAGRSDQSLKRFWPT
jgi:transposase